MLQGPKKTVVERVIRHKQNRSDWIAYQGEEQQSKGGRFSLNQFSEILLQQAWSSKDKDQGHCSITRTEDSLIEVLLRRVPLSVTRWLPWGNSL